MVSAIRNTTGPVQPLATDIPTDALDKSQKTGFAAETQVPLLPDALSLLGDNRGAGRADNSNNSPPLDLDEALSRLEQLQQSSISPELINSLLGKLMIEQAASQRHSALQDRMTSRQAAKADLMDQAGAMDKSADEMMKGAIVSLVLTVVSSAISIIGSVASLSNAISGFGDKVSNATKTGQALSEASKAAGMGSEKAASLGSKLTQEILAKTVSRTEQMFNIIEKLAPAVSGLASSAAQFGKSVTDSDAKHIEAEGARSAAKAQDKQADADQAKDIQQALDEMLKAIINFLKELRETEANMMQAMTKV